MFARPLSHNLIFHKRPAMLDYVRDEDTITLLQGWSFMKNQRKL